MLNEQVRKYAISKLSMKYPSVEFITTTANNEFYIAKTKDAQFALKTTGKTIVAHAEMDKYDIKDIARGIKPIESMFK